MKSPSNIAIPRDTRFNRRYQRAYVRVQERIDRRHRRTMGLSTFATDWTRTIEATPADNPPPRTIWMLWLQGLESAPAFVQACVASWRQHNPHWTIQVLDEASISEHIDLPAPPAGTSRNHWANILRLELLARYGGAWADATSLCLRPLDDWLGAAMGSGFFAFSRPQPKRQLANWFLAAQPDATLLHAWRLWCRIYLYSGRQPASYFWQHHTFAWLLQRSSALRRLWAATPAISARGPHIMQRLLDGHLTPQEWPTQRIAAQLPMLKMS